MAEAGGNLIADIGKQALGPIISGVLGSFLNRGNDKASRQAMQGNLELQKALFDIFKQQAALDLPFKADVQDQLRQRMARRIPRFTPQRGPAVNPLARRVRPTSIPVTQGLPTSLASRFGGGGGPSPGAAMSQNLAPRG